MKHNYPAFRFHQDGSSVVILSPEEDSMLDSGWSDKVPEGFDPVKAPTYRNVAFVPKAVDVEQIAEEVAKRKPGRPKKVA